MACEQDYWNQMYANACDQSAPSLLWRPRLFIDGNQWCALYGDNLQDGVAGFGDTPDKAMRNFDLNWCEQKVGGGTTATLVHNTALDERVLAEKFAMTNEELNVAIDTAARYSTIGDGRQECGQMMLKHLRKLLEIQYERAGAVRLNVANVGADETAPNAEATGA